jgi:hypothetical protein
MTDYRIAQSRAHLQIVTRTLAACGQLEPGHAANIALGCAAADLGLAGQIEPRIGKSEQSAIYVDFGHGVRGKFPVIHPTGALGDWMPSEEPSRLKGKTQATAGGSSIDPLTGEEGSWKRC